jgi:hypothetical protein
MLQVKRSAGLEQDVAAFFLRASINIIASRLNSTRDPTTHTPHHAVVPPFLGLGHAVPFVHDFFCGWIRVRPSPL